jgi:hypothetical protein
MSDYVMKLKPMNKVQYEVLSPYHTGSIRHLLGNIKARSNVSEFS